jgi:hypothetical protein
MLTMRDVVLARLEKIIKERMEDLTEIVMFGHVDSYEAYRDARGEARGLNNSLMYIQQAVEEVTKEDK